MPAGSATVHQAHVQQIECLLTLAEELHFGRTAERLGCSQSRVSQLVATLERRVGARLVERTSRRVSLTRVGAQFVKDVRPAYRALVRTFARARERAVLGALEELRVGFTGMVYEEITATFRALRDQCGVTVLTHELPLGSPFTAVLEGEVDAAIAELPVHEPELTVGFRFPPQDQLVVLGVDHPLADREALDLEDLAELDLLHRSGDAPGYWMSARTPPATPAGAPIRSTTGITTIQQGIALAASGRGAMLVCRPLADHHTRGDLRFLPVRGLENTSQLGLVWRTDRTSPALTALAGLLDRARPVQSRHRAADGGPGGGPPPPARPARERSA
ncbi:LysR family transcriptional regulator [Goodfellowiella coeruleoviolacea]|uniref:DNA-binding transcriptional regulator, LysR family n=1 Tax=Goodfellowiella coeruleoviolacea TaxID=334858 RepID=A0AAE3G9N0_9PSEU|nr:LysR family transcriptional regulator [Goodfellowiella coeruleoviolacea]MCP2163818.1 DNA-binding transcriptional regulator, LysR family [Goodfellowiella coeruleoviolacea]